MSQTFEFYDARAKEAALEAKQATLDNVRDRNLRAEKTWRGLATQARKVKRDREKAELEREARRVAEAGLIDGKTVTSWPSIRTDLKNAGANVVDQEVAIDGNLITSRNPDDIPAFSKALIEALGMSADQRAMETA